MQSSPIAPSPVWVLRAQPPIVAPARWRTGRPQACLALLSASTLFTKGRGSRCVALVAASGKKTVWFLRHGQSEHNVHYESGRREEALVLVDPGITSKGYEQASSAGENPLLATASTGPDALELAVASPLRRTTETALAALDTWLEDKEDRKVLLNPDLAEIGREVQPCNTGSPLPTLLARPKAERVDASALVPGWELEEASAADLAGHVLARMQRFREWLAARPESRIAVVTHHNLLVAMLGVSFLPAEVRRYTMEESGELLPDKPRKSENDAELSEEELAHVGIYTGTIGRLYAFLGKEMPRRLR